MEVYLITPFIDDKMRIMKKVSIICFLFISLHFVAASQTCLPCLQDGVIFFSQNQIDSFQTNYPNCTEILGNVQIYDTGNNITNLNGLTDLTYIGGSLNIDGCLFLTSLSGLNSLTSIGGNLRIAGNGMTSLTGLDNVTSAGGGIEISNNPDY